MLKLEPSFTDMPTIMPPACSLHRLALAALLALGLAAPSPPARAQPPATPTPGILADPVRVAAAADQSYALYLPSSYSPVRKWPMLFLFDRAGRGGDLATLLRTAAEAGGFALAASNTVASDTPWEINQRAVRLLLADVFRHAAVDERRLCFAGTGGTTRLAWAAAIGFGDAVAGALLFGGTTPEGDLPREAPPFPVFLAVGREAFNYQEVHRLAETLRSLGARHRLTEFSGSEATPPEATAGEGLRWLELQAMASGRMLPHEERLQELLAADLAAARRLGNAGDVLAAWERWRAVERDWAAFASEEPVPEDSGDLAARAAAAIAHARREMERLEAGPALARERQAEERAAAAEAVYRGRLAAALRRLRRDRRPPQPARLLADLEVASLLDRAGASTDPSAARAARRMLERAFVHLFADLAPRLLRGREYRRAAAALTAAAAIHGDRPEVWLELARALALAGENKRAREALEEATAHGLDDRQRLEADEVLAPLVGPHPPDPHPR